ncbi:MAG: OmpW family outer membrane protein [Thermodesulfobacteriota bacterium]
MKKIIAFACVLAFIVSVSPAAFSAEAGKMGVGLRVGYKTYAGDDESDPVVGKIDLDFDSTVAYGANFTWFFVDDFAAELAVEYAKSTMTVKGGGQSVDIGDVSQLPILLTLRYQPTLAECWMPYVGIGGGYFINDFSENENSRGANVELEDKFGFLVNVGCEYLIDGSNAIGLDLRYCWDSTKDKNTVNSESIDLNALNISLGYKYYF